MSTAKTDLDEFHLTGNSPSTPIQSNPNNNKSNQQKNEKQNTKNKENSSKPKSKSKPKPSPLNTSNNNNKNSPYFQSRQRPKTPDGLSKNQAKKWRKNWDYEEKQRIKALKAQSKSSKSPSLKQSPSNKPKSSQSNKPKKKKTKVLPQYDNPHTKKKTKKQALVQRIPIDKNKQHSMFAHLPQNEKYLFYISPKVTQSIHPVILRAGLYYNDGTSWGANTRCITMLNAFRCVVNDFKCPSNKSFGRELLTHLNPCIQFLNDCRPQSVSMGNTIRWLKSRISQIASEQKTNDKDINSVNTDDEDSDDIDTSDDEEQVRIRRMATEFNEDEQKNKIIQAITDYVFKIETADKMIQVELIDRIKDGDVILTYARSYVVEKGLIRAYNEGKKFKVIIVDARPHNEGKVLLNALSSNCPELDLSYTLINSASYVMSKEVNKVILGAACIMSNGSLVSRAGTATIALVAKHYKIPVMVCCETYKFSERVQIDSICNNELGDFDALVRNGKDKPSKSDKHSHGTPHQSLYNKDNDVFSSKLNLDIDSNEKKYDSMDDTGTDDYDDTDMNNEDDIFKNKLLGNWRNIPKLKMLNLKYDTTPAKLIQMVITELGVMPPSAAPVIIRECHKDRQLS